MLIRFFNRLYNFLLANKKVQFAYYSLLILYTIVFIVVYHLYGIIAVGYHTNIVIPLILLAFIELLKKLKIVSKNIYGKVRYLLTIYLIIESFLLLIRPIAITNQTQMGQYLSLKNPNPNSYFHLRPPHQHYRLKTYEFNYPRTTNSIGLPDKEWHLNKPPQTIRILCIGDSFTEGDGTAFTETYPAFLTQMLGQKYNNIQVLNAGRCGSDPFFDFQLLKDKLIAYQPDIILQSFTTNDFYFDMLVRGGQERFSTNHKLKYSKKVWWEPIYAASFTARILIQTIGGYDKNLIKRHELEKELPRMKMDAISLFTQYQKFTKENNIDLIVYTIPFKLDFEDKHDNADFYQLFNNQFSSFNLPFFNLESCYHTYIQKHHSNYKDFYWKFDGHHNAKGYKMMATCLEEILTPYINKRENQFVNISSSSPLVDKNNVKH